MTARRRSGIRRRRAAAVNQFRSAHAIFRAPNTRSQIVFGRRPRPRTSQASATQFLTLWLNVDVACWRRSLTQSTAPPREHTLVLKISLEYVRCRFVRATWVFWSRSPLGRNGELCVGSCATVRSSIIAGIQEFYGCSLWHVILMWFYDFYSACLSVCVYLLVLMFYAALVA